MILDTHSIQFLTLAKTDAGSENAFERGRPETDVLIVIFVASTSPGPRPPWVRRRNQFKNGGFTQKAHQMFSVHAAPEEFKNAAIICHFGFVFEGNSVKELHDYRDEKLFQVTRKQIADVSKFFYFEDRFRIAPFSWRISVVGKPNYRNKGTFSSLSGCCLILLDQPKAFHTWFRQEFSSQFVQEGSSRFLLDIDLWSFLVIFCWNFWRVHLDIVLILQRVDDLLR